MQRTWERWKGYVWSTCFAAFLLTAGAVPVFAEVPSDDALPTVSSPAKGILLVEGVQEGVYIRLVKDGTPFTVWAEKPYETDTLVYEPLAEGEYSVEVCLEETIEESTEKGGVIPAEKIVPAKWENGALFGSVQEPEMRESGNRIDLSAAVYSEEEEERIVYFSSDAYVRESNTLLAWNAMFGWETAYEEKIRPAQCRYYSMGEMQDNGAHIWYKLEDAEAVTFHTSAETDCVVKPWGRIDAFDMVLDEVQTTGYIEFEHADVSVTLKGDTAVDGLFFGDGEDIVQIQGDPADGADTLRVGRGGIRTNGNQLILSDLAQLASCAGESSAVYMSDENGNIIIREIAGDVLLTTECHANSAITAYTGSVLFENIGGNLTVLAKGGNGIEAEQDVCISHVDGKVKIVSEEGYGILAGGKVSLPDAGQVTVTGALGEIEKLNRGGEEEAPAGMLGQIVHVITGFLSSLVR